MTQEKKLYILRGIPGSGKSTLGRELLKGTSGSVFSTDDFFLDETGNGYHFDPKQLGQAHQWNQKRSKEAMEKGTSPIVIDNTNTQAWEPQPYVLMAKEYGYSVEIREPNTPWKLNAEELAKRNNHNVPLETIQKMLDRFENYTVEDILQAQRPNFQTRRPAQARKESVTKGPPPVTHPELPAKKTHILRSPGTKQQPFGRAIPVLLALSAIVLGYWYWRGSGKKK